jgi:uncharacterized repeat protein (TIGR03803 family)
MQMPLRIACVLLSLVLIAFPAVAQTFQVLYTFTGGADGGYPWDSPLLYKGMLYGTTFSGGTAGYGVIYQVDAKSGRETVLHTFLGGPADGGSPDAGLIRDSAGNLWGAADMGGVHGAGALFQLTPSGAITLYSLAAANGQGPQSTLVRDAQGNFYGTAYFYGPHGNGTILKLDTAGNLTTLFAFNNYDGGGPKFGPLVMRKGYLYGTTYYGGRYNSGNVYRFDLGTGKEQVVYSFTGGTDGLYPLGGMVADSAGNLYGTTSAGGNTNSVCEGEGAGCGTVFKLDTSGKLTTVHAFTGGSDGWGPWGSLTIDAQGNLYGTTNSGGYVDTGYCRYGCGTVFQIDSAGNFSTLHAFDGTDGGGERFLRSARSGALPPRTSSSCLPAAVWRGNPGSPVLPALARAGV